jgi:hypothetical protein
MFLERAVVVSVLSLLIILTIDSTRTREVKGIYEGCFWLMKSDWKNCADIVLAGDSRTGSGVSPAKMSEHLPGRIILNYAFDGVQFHEEYLRSIPKVFDSRTSEKVVILGITPRALIGSSITNDQFKDSKRLSKYHSEILLAVMDRPLRLLYPMRIREFFYMFFLGRDTRRFFRIYHADGWAERNTMQSDSEEMVNLYKETFIKHQVSPNIIAGLLRFVQEWTKIGIKVYGFRPPTSPQMFEAENALSGFDEKSFVLSFEQAGGKWIAVKQTDYPTYDGSHLRPGAAEAFSFDLGVMISERLNDRFNVHRTSLGYAAPADSQTVLTKEP